MDSDKKVIIFPKTKQGSPPNNLGEIRERVRVNQEEIACDLSLRLVQNALMTAEEIGYDITKNEESSADLLFAVESLKSMMLRSVNIKHPFQESATRDIPEHNGKDFIEKLRNYD